MRAYLVALIVLLLPFTALAEPVTFADSRGVQRLEAPPKRPVALTWSLVEQLLGLGVRPAGVADPSGYRTWVARPALPEGVADLGLRQEPNLEAIAALAPDVILIADDQLAFAPMLEEIAPVVHFDAFAEDQDNRLKAEEIFLELARLFDREAFARDKLAALERNLERLRTQVADHFDGAPPKVAVVRFLDAARVAVHGANAMPDFALRALGLENAVDLPATTWGITLKPVEALGTIEEGVVLYMEPFPQAEAVFSRPLWRAMPFVSGERFASLPVTWTYGGALSIGYLAEAIAGRLLELPSE